MLDDRQATPSIQADDLHVWTREWNVLGWRSYLGSLWGAEDVPAYAAPARVGDVAGLPPAFISVGTIDGFRDENMEYASRLNHAGVPCELHLYAGLPHGYGLATEASAVKLAVANMDNWLARQLLRTGS
jgi:acetyl esterase/lipase